MVFQSDKAVASRLAFSRVLRAFQTGGITLSDLVSRVDEDLAAGVPPTELLHAIRDREVVECFPDAIHEVLLRRLSSNGPAGLQGQPPVP